MAATLADASGPLARVVQATLKAGAADAIGQQALCLIAAACTEAGISPDRISRVGVSSCGPFTFGQQGLGLVSPNLCGGLTRSDDLPNDWTLIPLESVLRTQFADVVIENDCVAALIGDRAFGAAQNQNNVVYVTWSTGIGFGLCVDGHILRGKSGNAGHAGHMLLSDSSDALCGCGNRGDLEALIAGRNLGKRLGQSLPQVFSAAQAGDAEALSIIAEAARWFGRGLYNLVTTLDTQCLLVGGSVWRNNANLLAPLVEAEISSRFPALTQGVLLQSALLDDLVTDLGALAMVMPEAWRDDWRQRKPWENIQTVALDDAS